MVTSKSILTVSSLAVALMFGGGVYILANLNSFAKPITEKIATRTMGVDVSIGSMDVDLQAKTVEVDDIRVDNPPGYKKPHIITVDRVGVSLAALAKGLVTFNDINVEGTKAYVEVTPSGTNLQDLKALMAAQEKKNPDKEPSAVKVVIDKIAVSEAKVYPSVTLVESLGDMGSVNVPPVVLRGIGTKDNGVLAKDAIQQVMTQLLKSFSKTASQAGFYEGLSADALREIGQTHAQDLKDQIESGLDDLSNDFKGLFE